MHGAHEKKPDIDLPQGLDVTEQKYKTFGGVSAGQPSCAQSAQPC